MHPGRALGLSAPHVRGLSGECVRASGVASCASHPPPVQQCLSGPRLTSQPRCVCMLCAFARARCALAPAPTSFPHAAVHPARFPPRRPLCCLGLLRRARRRSTPHRLSDLCREGSHVQCPEAGEGPSHGGEALDDGGAHAHLKKALPRLVCGAGGGRGKGGVSARPGQNRETHHRRASHLGSGQTSQSCSVPSPRSPAHWPSA